MKPIYLSMLLIVPIYACKKGSSPEELKNQQLAAMKKYIVNDWKISKIVIVKPASEYGKMVFQFVCNKNETFSFRGDNSFIYTGNPLCSIKEPITGVWSLPKTDSLLINFTWTRLVAYEKLELTELTAGVMKWNIIASNGNGNQDDTLEYTLVPR